MNQESIRFLAPRALVTIMTALRRIWTLTLAQEVQYISINDVRVRASPHGKVICDSRPLNGMNPNGAQNVAWLFRLC
jgi:hypothetical protein